MAWYSGPYSHQTEYGLFVPKAREALNGFETEVTGSDLGFRRIAPAGVEKAYLREIRSAPIHKATRDILVKDDVA